MAGLELDNELQGRLAALGIEEDDLVEKFVLGSGSGGQKINKTHTCVSLHHLPSGTHVRCQESRSREKNRHRAREILCERLERGRTAEEQARKAAAAKQRRRNRQPNARVKAYVLATKRRRALTKRLRQTIDEEQED